MKRNFYINNIDSVDELNALSIALNALEEVSRIKIGKDMISFSCEQADNIESVLSEINKNLVIRERINTRNRKFDFTVEKQDLIFMFNNLDSQEEASEIEEIVSKYSMYEDVSVDFSNKLLKVTTTDKKALIRLNHIVDKINPKIDVELWKRPFRSEDLFNEKFTKRYIRIAAIAIALAIGIVTYRDPSVLTSLAWLVGLMVMSEPVIKKIYKEIQIKRFFHSYSAILVSCLLGWLYGAYFESVMVMILFQLGEVIVLRFSTFTMGKINDIINVPQIARKEVNGEVFMTSLDEFDIGDIVVIAPGEVIPLGGEVMEGRSTLDMYSITGSKVEEPVKVGDEVQSGSINLTKELRVKVLYGYGHSAVSKIVNIATLAPSSPSKTQQLIELISKWMSIILVVIAFICGVVLPIMDFGLYYREMYLAAILLVISSTFAYKQSSSFAVLAGVVKAFANGIVIKENSGLDDLNACDTIIYDRFDGVEVTEEEMDLFAKLTSLYKKLIVFNDGPITLENDQYEIYNDLSVAEKIKIMEQASTHGAVAYIGDSFKDVALLQKAYVGISRGGLHDQKVVEHCDIMITNSEYETIYETFLISKKQKFVVIGNIVFGIICTLLLVMFAATFTLPWWLALVLYDVMYVLVLLHTHTIMD